MEGEVVDASGRVRDALQESEALGVYEIAHVEALRAVADAARVLVERYPTGGEDWRTLSDALDALDGDDCGGAVDVIQCNRCGGAVHLCDCPPQAWNEGSAAGA